MNLATSLRAPELSKFGLSIGAVIAAAVSVTSSAATTFMTQEQLPTIVPGYPVRGLSRTDEAFIAVDTDTMYKQALQYMLKHPPRANGKGAKVDAENEHLAEENRQLYEDMGRTELLMNYFAAKCSEMHPAHHAICDGRAMLRLHQIQQQRRALTGF